MNYKTIIEHCWRVYDEDFPNNGVLKIDSKDDLQWGFRFDDSTNELYIAFRGSDNRDNWSRNFKLVPTYISRLGFAHRGFMGAWKSIEPYISPIIDHAKDNNFRIVFCGHSLGGAIAQIGCEVISRTYPNCRVVTIGSPKVFGRFSRVKARHFRLVIDDDPVPKLMGLFYKHYEWALLERTTEGIISPSDHTCKHYLEVFNDL